MSELYEKLKKFETDDFQNRNGGSIKRGVPDTINVYPNKDGSCSIVVLFKHTEEEKGKQYVERYLIGLKIKKITSMQVGDYHNDWIEIEAVIGED